MLPPIQSPQVQPPAPRKEPISALDLTVSTFALLLTVILGAVVARVGLYLLMVLDACPNLTCNVGRTAGLVGADLTIGYAVAALGLVLTVIRLVLRKRAWPFAVGTLVVYAVISLAGGLGYFAVAGA